MLKKLLLRAKKRYSSMGNQCKNSHILFINFSTKKGKEWGFNQTSLFAEVPDMSRHSARCRCICGVENERVTVVCSRCRQNLKFGNFTLSFERLRRRIFLRVNVAKDYRELMQGRRRRQRERHLKIFAFLQ